MIHVLLPSKVIKLQKWWFREGGHKQLYSVSDCEDISVCNLICVISWFLVGGFIGEIEH